MKRLTVIYDAKCGFCVTCRHWLGRQPKFVEMDFVAAGSGEARERFPDLAGEAEELVVVADDGQVWKGAKAWLMTLWALAEYREWALRLSAPALMPLARGLFAVVSTQRRRLSGWLGLKPEEEVVEELKRVCVPRCAAEPVPMAVFRK